MIKIANVLVGTDFSEVADTSLAYGRTLAKDFGANLPVLHVAQNLLTAYVSPEMYVGDLSGFQIKLEESARKQLIDRLGPQGWG